MSFSMMLQAQQVTVDEAKSKAQAFLNASSHRSAPARSDAAATQPLALAYTSQSTTSAKVCYYVFNCGEAEGFVIVGGDEAAHEILGYADHGTFDYDQAPDNFKWWLGQYQQQIAAAIDHAQTHPQATYASAASSASRSSVAPLIQTRWDQGVPYSDAINADFHSQCPELSNNDFVTGCVATSMAQVMRYYSYPAQGVGSHSKSTTYDDTYTFIQQADFGNTTYDWANMTLTYSGLSTHAQKDAVATLMYHAGVSIDMNYGTSANGGSSSWNSYIASALIDYFKYDKGIRFEQRCYYSDNEWEELLYNELAARRPVFYSGSADKSGHSFICDGYDAEAAANNFHFNWGWGGSCDGWYAVSGASALQPNSKGIGGAGEGKAFTGFQSILTGVKPDAGGVGPLHLVALDKGDFKLTIGGEEKTSYHLVKSPEDPSPVPAMLTAVVQSLSPLTSGYNLGVRAYDRNTGKTHFWRSAAIHDGLSYMDYSEKSFSIDLSELEYNGTYELQTIYRPAGSSSDDDWQLLTAIVGDVLPTVIVTGGKATELQDITFSLPSSEVQQYRTIRIQHNDSYHGTVRYSSQNTDVATVDANGIITGIKPGVATITVCGDACSLNGNELYKYTEATLSISVVETVKNSPTISISSDYIFMGETATISVEGYDIFPGETRHITYSSTDESVVTVADGIVTAVGPGTASIVVSASDTKLSKGFSTSFHITVTSSPLVLSAAPYFTNDNNPYEDDVRLYIPLKNISSVPFSGLFYIKVEVGEHACLWSQTLDNFDAGKETTYLLSLKNLLSNMIIDAEKTISFYHDYDKTTKTLSNPMNIPSITYTYRDKFEYKCTIGDAGVGTLILPFDADIPDGWEAYQCLETVGHRSLALSKSKMISRNVPYIIVGTPGTQTFTGPKVIDATSVTFTEGMLSGTFLADTYAYQPGDYTMEVQGDNEVVFRRFSSSDATFAPAFQAFVHLTDATQPECLYLPTIYCPAWGHNYSTLSSTADANGLYDIECCREASHIKANAKAIKDYTPTSYLELAVDAEGHYSTATAINLTDAHQLGSAKVAFTAPAAPTYSRIGIKDQWETLVLPFSVTIDDDDPYDFYTVSAVTGDQLTLTKVTGSLDAGTPVLIRINADQVNGRTYDLTLTADNATLSTMGELEATAGDLTLKGSYDVADITDQAGYVIADNAFWNIQSIRGEDQVLIAAFSAYLASASAGNDPERLSIGTEDITALEALEAITEGEAEYFDLAGHRLHELRNGVNIVKRGARSYKVILN